MLLLVVVVVGGLMLLALGVLVAMSSQGGDGTTASATPATPTTGFASGNYKWHDVEGLKADNPEAWPRGGEFDWWNPFAAPGSTIDGGGIRTAVGDLPVVNPPAHRRNPPYNMDTPWQEGGAEANDYYKRHCGRLVISPGRLFYQGPHKFCYGGKQCAHDDGQWVWWTLPPPGKLGLTALMGMGNREMVRMITEKDYRDLLYQGHEVPPWLRRGPMAPLALRAFQKYCTPSATSNPRFNQNNDQ